MDAYNQLIDIGYKQNEIDNMDIIYHLQLLGRRNVGDNNKSENDVVYADDIFNGL